MRELWSLSDDSLNAYEPIVVGSRVFANRSGYAICLDADTGELLWSTALAAGYVRMCYDRGILAATAGGNGAPGYLVGLDSSTGEVLWQRKGFSDALTVAGGLLLNVDPVSKGVTAHSILTGRPRWTWVPDRQVSYAPVQQVAVASGVAYVAWDFGSVVAGLDLTTGVPRWQRRLWPGPNGYLSSTTYRPALLPGLLVVGDAVGHVASLDPTSGEPRWEVDLGLFRGSPTLLTTRTVGLVTDSPAGDYSTQLVALSVSDGSTRWTRSTPTTASHFCVPSVAGGLIHTVVNEGPRNPRRLDSYGEGSGAKIFSYQLGEYIDGGVPVVSRGRIYVQKDTTLHVLATGPASAAAPGGRP